MRKHTITTINNTDEGMEYKPLYSNGGLVLSLPGTTTMNPFFMEKYKKEHGRHQQIIITIDSLDEGLQNKRKFIIIVNRSRRVMTKVVLTLKMSVFTPAVPEPVLVAAFK